MTNPFATKLEFEKQCGLESRRCTIEVCDDGSVYVEGDEIEMIFEFAPDNLERAIHHVNRLGYLRKVREETVIPTKLGRSA